MCLEWIWFRLCWPVTWSGLPEIVGNFDHVREMEGALLKNVEYFWQSGLFSMAEEGSDYREAQTDANCLFSGNFLSAA